MPIRAPKILVFGGSEPLNVIGHYRDPQSAHPWPKPHLHTKFGADRSTGATWARAEGIKKRRKKARKETYSGKLGVRTDHPRSLFIGLHRPFKFYANRCIVLKI